MPSIVREQKSVVFFAGALMLVPVDGGVRVVGTKCASADGRTASPATAAAAAAATKVLSFSLKISFGLPSH
jgi:hypothetical protein